MKVLITGGSGTLGKEIANLVFKKKYEVNILTRNKNLKSHNPQLKYYYWNPKKEDIDLDCFNNVDCVINLAGFSVFSLWTKANKTKIFESATLECKMSPTIKIFLFEKSFSLDFNVKASRRA